jgi:hypothetical protein
MIRGQCRLVQLISLTFIFRSFYLFFLHYFCYGVQWKICFSLFRWGRVLVVVFVVRGACPVCGQLVVWPVVWPVH